MNVIGGALDVGKSVLVIHRLHSLVRQFSGCLGFGALTGERCRNAPGGVEFGHDFEDMNVTDFRMLALTVEFGESAGDFSGVSCAQVFFNNEDFLRTCQSWRHFDECWQPKIDYNLAASVMTTFVLD